jgi:L-ascorbate metabolism protein UlaG (beta-lactamase superfamily)
MDISSPRITYVGGPTALIEVGGLRLLTDPTLDPGGTEYPTAAYTLVKSQSPALTVDAVGKIDAVLLSHDHHFDNLDHAGRALLSRAGRVLTTVVGAERLGGNSEGFAPWQSTEMAIPGGGTVVVTATLARHGPAEGDRGPCIGFVITPKDSSTGGLYVSGDTVWFEGVAEVARRFSVGTAVLFMGAARVAVAGPSHLTFTADEGVEAARAFGRATIVPLHFEGWAHFSEHRSDIERAFDQAGLGTRLSWLSPGVPKMFSWS